MVARLFETDAPHPRGVVLVGHGLNTRPEAMDGLIHALRGRGFDCQRLSLYEHEPVASRRAPAAAVVGGWMRAFAEAYEAVVQRHTGQPVYALGFSLSALVTLRFLDTHPAAGFDAMFLLAPPVALTRPAALVRHLVPLSRVGAVLPSAAPAAVRARRGTPLAEYAAMLELADAVQTLERRQELRLLPTSIALDEDDELVSCEGVRGWMARNGLDSWTLAGFPDRQPRRRTYKHLAISEDALGRPAWGRLIEDIAARFASR